MKPFLSKFFKSFNRYRDWLWIALVAGAIAFFMQKVQAEKNRDPEAIWQDEYSQVVRPAANPLEVGAETGPVDPAKNILDTFAPIKESDIQPISDNPIFTPAAEYEVLVRNLKTLRADFQAAQDVGDIKTAIDRLRAYVKEDPSGKRLSSEWTTEPQQLLDNLVCNELQRTVEDTFSAVEETRTNLPALGQSEPYKALETIDTVISSVKKAISEVEANTSCQEDGRISSDRLQQLQQGLETLLQERKNLNERLVRQEYDRVFQQANALDANTPPEQVAKTIQAIQEFRTLLDKQEEPVLAQAQVDRLEEAGKKVEANKENLIEQVKQTIDRISSDPDAATNLDRIEEILNQYNYLKLLGESESRMAPQKRLWDSRAQSLLAAQAVTKMQEIMEEISTDLTRLETLAGTGEDTGALVQKINGGFTQIENMRKNTKNIRGEFNLKIRKDFTKLNADFNRIKKTIAP